MKLDMPKHGFRFPTQALFLILGLALTGAAIWYFFLTDRTPPSVSLTPEAIMVSKVMRFTVHAQDEDSPLARLTVVATMHGDPFPVLDQVLDTGGGEVEASFTLERLPFDTGEVILEITATDASLANFGEGNSAVLTRSCTLDTDPPQIFVQSLEHNLTQGGAGAVAFQASEAITDAGVMLEDTDIFFPAFKQANGNWVCLFAFPYFMQPEGLLARAHGPGHGGQSRSRGLLPHGLARKLPRAHHHGERRVSGRHGAGLPRIRGHGHQPRGHLRAHQ